MQEELQKLLEECVEELETIGIEVSLFGEIDIKFSRKSAKRYGCCKQEEPDTNTAYRKNGRIYYRSFQKHHIEISPWVMALNRDIIKNTIMHELIHCFPNCNNHGNEFKEYAKVINSKLGYDIGRVGNKKEDYEKSNLEYHPDESFKYQIFCDKCGQTFYRKRLSDKFLKQFRCGICGNKFRILMYEGEK